MKNIFNIILTILIINFSFYYTNKVSEYIKNKDPIMIKIRNKEINYYKEPVNAIINNNTIIPGRKGQEIDIDNSYIKMKKINDYNESLLVFNYLTPQKSISNNKDKLIINGNKEKKNISILLKINDLNILNKITNDNCFNDINFIFNNSFITKNYNYIKLLENNIVINQNEKLYNLELIDYCYTTDINSNNKCLNYNKFCIIPKEITNNYYYNTYQIIDNGNILVYQIINDKNIYEIKLIINSIKNLGFKIVSLDKLIKE